jgi:hypothetical protein
MSAHDIERFLGTLEAFRQISPDFVRAEEFAEEFGVYTMFIGSIARLLEQCFELTDRGLPIEPTALGLDHAEQSEAASFLISIYLQSLELDTDTGSTAVS